MASLRKCRAFLTLVVALVAIGYSHQALGRFHPHHHEIDDVTGPHHHDSSDHHHHSEDHSSDEDQEKKAEHMTEHAALVAVVSAQQAMARGELSLIGSLAETAAAKA